MKSRVFIQKVNQILGNIVISEDEINQFPAMERIEKARYLSSIKAPFFHSFFKKMMFKAIPNAKETDTMVIDKNGNLFYGEPFVNKLDMDLLIGVLCHEAMHITQRTFERIQDRNLLYWNWATDFAINRELLSKGFKLPYFVLAPDPKTGMGSMTIDNVKILFEIHDNPAEEIYEEIVKKMEAADKQPPPQQGQQGQPPPPSQGKGQPPPPSGGGAPPPPWKPKPGDIVWNDAEGKYGRVINAVGPTLEVEPITEQEAIDAMKRQ